MARSDVDVRLKIVNFGKSNIDLFERNWNEIRSSLLASFALLDQLGFDDSLIRVKNAVIPISYYIFKQGLSDDILKSSYPKQDKERISTWLIRSLLKGIFGGHSDSVLRLLRDVVQTKSKRGYFPLPDIKAAFKSSPDKNYSFNDDILKGYLHEKYHSGMASLVLHLLYPEVAYKYGSNVAEDHLHAKMNFIDPKRFASIGFAPGDAAFCQNEGNWNSVLNLQLLSEADNKSKGDSSPEDWYNKEGKTAADLFVDQGISQKIVTFKGFIENREKIFSQPSSPKSGVGPCRILPYFREDAISIRAIKLFEGGIDTIERKPI